MALRTDDVSWREVEGDIVLLDEQTWKYIHLNASASLLWRELIDGATEVRLVQCLQSEFDLAEADAARDVAAFLEELRQRDYLTAA